MKLSRREALAVGAGLAVTASTLSLGSIDAFAATKAEDAIKEFTGGKEAKTGKITLNTPEIAENGNTVPIGFEVDSPMTKDAYVEEVLVLADGNPRPGVATFKFSPMSGEASASTRIRLAKTQNIIGVAKMSDGSFHMAKNVVKVTIGGCGG